MTNAHDDHDKQIAEQIGTAIERELIRLVVVDGHCPDMVLGRALALVFGLVTTRHGGAVAVEVARKAAAQCRGWPAQTENPLSAMQPMGRA